jgi:hypothetical protein
MAAWDHRRAELTKDLHWKVFRSMPDKLHNVRLEGFDPPQTAGRFTVMTLSSQETVPVRVLVRKKSSESPLLLYVASDGEDAAYIDTLFRGLDVPDSFDRMIVFPRGVGEVPWDKSFWKQTFRNAMQVGETVDSMRAADVRTALEAEPAREITVMGKGVSGAIGLYAAIFSQKVKHVVLIDPPSSHADGPIFLNVLRYTDLPEAAALLAPRRLTFYSRTPPAYEYTRHVWKLYGKPDEIGSTVRIRWSTGR